MVKPKDLQEYFARSFVVVNQQMTRAAQTYISTQNELSTIEQCVRVVHIFMKKFKTQVNKQLDEIMENSGFVQLFIDLVVKLESGWGLSESIRRVQRLGVEVLVILVEHLVEKDNSVVQASPLLSATLSVMDHVLLLLTGLTQGTQLSDMTEDPSGDNLIVAYLSLIR